MIFNNTIEIILPKLDNEKNPINWDIELENIGRAFGGFTLFDSGIFGVWYDNNVRYQDDNNILRLDYVSFTNELKSALNSLLSYALETQLSLYIRYNNRTTFVDLKNYRNFLNYLYEIN